MSFRLQKVRNTILGDKSFYLKVFSIIIPVIVQNGVSNFVSVLDNLMVGALGDNEMSGVAVANQLLFIFTLAVFGGLSGPGIFTSQFHGAGNIDGVRHTFRIKVMLAALISVVGLTVLILGQDLLIGFFLQGEAENSVADPTQILHFAKEYLFILFFGLPPLALSFAYASTMRETGDALWPMIGSVSAVAVNMLGNWLLIFGNLGCPRLGVSGAAIATALSRYVELGVVSIRCHTHKDLYPFIRGAYKSLRVPKDLLVTVCKKGSPLLFNEVLWSTGMTMLNMAYSMCGIIVVGAVSINSTVSNLFNVVAYSVGTAVSVIIGHDLGADRYDDARSHVWKLFAFGIGMAIISSTLLIILSGPICSLYSGVSSEVKALAKTLITITALICPITVVSHVSYFTIRAGGRTGITFLFDCGFTLAVMVPLAFFLVKVLHLDIIPVFTSVQFTAVLKAIFGFLLVKKGIWLVNITRDPRSQSEKLQAK